MEQLYTVEEFTQKLKELNVEAIEMVNIDDMGSNDSHQHPLFSAITVMQTHANIGGSIILHTKPTKRY